MKELDHDLEAELRRLLPAEPPPRLSMALAHDLRAAAAPPPAAWSRRVRWSLWTSWTLTAAAAAVAAAAWWSHLPQKPSPGADGPEALTGSSLSSVVPIGSTNVLLDACDEGIVLLDDGRAAHRLRLRYLDTIRLQERDASSSIAVSRPREEVRFVPVIFY